MRRLLILGVLICRGISPGQAGDATNSVLDNWHRWRGPLGTGVAPRGNPPVRWSETDNVRWKVEIPGRDTSYVPSAIVHDNLFYFTKMNSAILTAVNARTGEVLIPTGRLSGLSGNIYASPVLAPGLVLTHIFRLAPATSCGRNASLRG